MFNFKTTGPIDDSLIISEYQNNNCTINNINFEADNSYIYITQNDLNNIKTNVIYKISDQQNNFLGFKSVKEKNDIIVLIGVFLIIYLMIIFTNTLLTR